MKEIWKDIDGYEGLYQVSNFGNVRRTADRDSAGRKIDTKILKLGEYPNGYTYARLSKDGVCKNILTHRLVAIAFVERKNDNPIINHKDQNRKNNKPENLEWCTYKYNNNYGDAVDKRVKNTDYILLGIKLAKPIYQKRFDGTMVRKWNGAREAARALKIKSVGICMRAKGKQKNIIWVYMGVCELEG